MRQELSMTPAQAVPSLTRRQFCSTCMWQAELPTVSDAADNEKDLRSILVIETGAAGKRVKNRTENKATT